MISSSENFNSSRSNSDPAEESLNMVITVLNRIRKTNSISATISRHNYDFALVSPNFQFGDEDSAKRVESEFHALQQMAYGRLTFSSSCLSRRPLRYDGERIFWLGLDADIGLATRKAFTGLVCGSTAVNADAAYSISDVVLCGVSLLSFQAARIPKDKEHPYGHGKFETFGDLGISGVLLATAGGIGWHAFDVFLGLWLQLLKVVNQSMNSSARA